MEEINKDWIEEAKHCTKCTEWLHHCKAECCRVCSISLTYCISNPKCDFTKKYVVFKILLASDMQWYFRLRGFTYARSILKINSKYCVVKGEYIYIYKDCKLLKNNLCLGHPNLKPKICREFNFETMNTMEGVMLTPNCLFKYKLEGIKHENNKRKE